MLVLNLTVLARVLFTAPSQFEALLASPPITDGSPNQVASRVVQLVDLWLDRFDAVGSSSSSGSWRRKLWACALVSMIPFGNGLLLDRLDQILNICVDVLGEIEIENGDGSAGGHSGAFMIPGSPGGVSDGSGGGGGLSPGAAGAGGGAGGAGASVYAANLRSILQNDTVHSTDLRLYLNQKVSQVTTSLPLRHQPGANSPSVHDTRCQSNLTPPPDIFSANSTSSHHLGFSLPRWPRARPLWEMPYSTRR